MSHKFLALSQTPKGVIYGNSKLKFMGICGSLMDIFDQTKREAQIKFY